MFSPYATARLDEKKKKSDAARKRDMLCESLGAYQGYYWGWYDDQLTRALDPRWLDVAVEIQNLGMIGRLARPGHGAANAFLKASFDTYSSKPKSDNECHQVVAAMVNAGHPDATDAFVATLEKFAKKCRPITMASGWRT